MRYRHTSLLLGGDIDALADLDSSSAIATFFGTDGVFTGGGVDALLPDGTPGYAALSALPVFIGENGLLTGGGVDALADYDALSAVPVLIGTDGLLTGGGVDALAGLDSLSAVPVFIGTDGLLTGGGVDALAGLDSLSAVPVFIGTDGVFTGGGLAALGPNEDGEGGYDLLSAIPPYLDIPAQPAATRRGHRGYCGARGDVDPVHWVRAGGVARQRGDLCAARRRHGHGHRHTVAPVHWARAGGVVR